MARFKPDIIVIYEATNDLSANSYELARDQGVIEARPQVDDFNWLTRHSLLALLIQKNLEIMRQQRLATSSSGKVRLDAAKLDVEFREDYTNLVEASAKIANIVVTVHSRRVCVLSNRPSSASKLPLLASITCLI